MNFGEVQSAQLAKSTLFASTLGSLGSFRSFKAYSDTKEWGVESNEKLPHYSIPGKTAPLVPEFAEENLPLSRTAALGSEFAVEGLPLGRTLW